MTPVLQRQREQSRDDRYFRYNMVRSIAYYSNRCDRIPDTVNGSMPSLHGSMPSLVCLGGVAF